MDDGKNYFRFIQSKWIPFLNGVIFLLTFYSVYFIFSSQTNVWISSLSIAEFTSKYGIFIPLVYGLLLIFITYIFYFIKYIIRLNFWIVNLFITFLVYWFSLFFWIQLVYFEPRFTEVATFIIDNFWNPIIYSSLVVLIFSIISIFIKRKI